MKLIGMSLASLILPAVTVESAAAAGWSSWVEMDTIHLSFRYLQVNRGTCALAFRNDSSRRLVLARVQYVHDGRADDNILPGLDPGQSRSRKTSWFRGRCTRADVHVYHEEWN
jgi:hypothetical protein